MDSINQMTKGKIELAIGPMFSGKTTWLIKKLEKKDKTEDILIVHYFLDNRYEIDSIVSHDRKKLKAVAARDIKDILRKLKENPKASVLGLDELQFFDPSIASFFKELKERGVKIYSAGLNVDYNNKTWESTEAVTKVADTIHKFKAICAICGKKNATITRRKVREDTRIVIGGSKLYDSLCEKDYTASLALREAKTS